MGLFGILKEPETVDDQPPSQHAIAKALDLPVQDKQGQEHSLRSIAQGYRRTILVFVRHNHCGACHAYVSSMNNDSTLKGTTTDEQRNKAKSERTQVVIIGHGSYEGIERYQELSHNPFDMYVDSTKRIHQQLGLTRRHLSKSDEVPEYFDGMSYNGMVWDSVKKMASSGSLLWKGGDFALLGGDFVLDHDLKCIYCHRMQTTTDHTPVKDLAAYVNGEPLDSIEKTAAAA